MRTADKKAKKKIQKKNDVLMKKVVRELLAIEGEQNQTQNKYGGAQQRHCWSDVFSRRNAIHRLLVDIVKKVIKKTTQTKNSQVGSNNDKNKQTPPPRCA